MENTAKDKNTTQTDDQHLNIETVTPDTVNVQPPAGEKSEESSKQADPKAQQANHKEPQTNQTPQEGSDSEPQKPENNQTQEQFTGGQEENINYYQEAKHEPLPGQYDTPKPENSKEKQEDQTAETPGQQPKESAEGQNNYEQNNDKLKTETENQTGQSQPEIETKTPN
ncbi:hypothetical protein HDF26_002319 [Pedobacter cryoconitis]|uniref:hypothetical protein n=1 Tax=Pedobacter cryoconitis TaxID=188932 RepID=UPI00160C9129|nr:hypothetical protein [Pedobacter cryoconitis]MBB6271862.1 hypothetical protein [Pedobacter cryoconitis]